LAVSDPWESTRPIDPTLLAPPAAYPVTYGAAPLSDKNKIIAGLLQLVPGFVIGLGGLGRLYAGHRGLGIAQLAVTVLSWISFWCGFLLVAPWLVTAAAWLWFVVDGIVLMAGRPVDQHGRLLRG
jgi:TM2 domain-containing membrane protein YozV